MSQLIFKTLEALRANTRVLPKELIREAANEKPENLDVLFDIGIECAQNNRLEQAFCIFNELALFKKGDPRIFYNLGLISSLMNEHQQALKFYEFAQNLDPLDPAIPINSGASLNELKQYEKAIASLNRAIALNPNIAEAWSNKGTVLSELKLYEAAAKSFHQALILNPDLPSGKGILLHAKMLACDWQGVDALYQSICQDITENKKSADPFGFQGICDDESLLQKCAEIFSNTKFPASPQFDFGHLKRDGGEIRIGYLCGEFREQATAILMTELWELHDKSQFEILAFDNGWDDKSLRRKRIEKAFNEFIDISRLSDDEAASLIADKKIDILVNLNGFFGKPRQGIFAKKPSPIQVNYLGFPGTIGSTYMDYLIADKVVIPEESRQYYTEKIVHLPHCYQANDSKRQIDGRSYAKKGFGLPEEGFVFCCFNNSYKILPQMFDIWMRLLRALPTSVLWLIEDNPDATRHLKQEAQARGVDAARIIFAKRVPLSEHLGRHQCADLFLDTLPYNAHTTASDALWAGLPVLTCTGTSFAGRVATSMLTALDLPELISANIAEYESLAYQLASQPEKLQQIKAKLAKNRLNSPLFNTNLMAKDLEGAYLAMYKRFQEGSPPEHINLN